MVCIVYMYSDTMAALNRECAKWLIAFIFLAISIANIQRGFNLMRGKWTEFGEAEFYRLFDQSSSSVNWYEVMKVVKIKFDIFIPGVPRRYTSPVGAFLLGSMLVGLSLRNVCPLFSVFAWGIPAIVLASLFLQISSHMFSQAYQVKLLQMHIGLKIKSVC